MGGIKIRSIDLGYIVFSDELASGRGYGARLEYYRKKVQVRARKHLISAKNKTMFPLNLS